jgi:penicillin-binding protein 1C
MNPPQGKPARRRRWLRHLLLSTGLLLAGLWWLAPWLTAWPEQLSHAPLPSTVITDRTGASLRRMAGDHGRSGGLVTPGEIPAALIAATLAAEDRRFWSHGGIDFPAVARAAWQGTRHGRLFSGASTITQQLAKLARHQPRSLPGKFHEALLARRIEMTWPKERILREYLSRISYGAMASGCREAASHFFGKPVSDLSPAECAMLAGLPQAPARLNPWKHRAAAEARQQWILKRMEALGSLAAEDADRARGEPLRWERGGTAFAAPHFVDYALSRLPEAPRQGREIRTTLDARLQRRCEEIVAFRLDALRARHVQQAAVVVLDNEQGDILAMIGSADYHGPADGKVNGCLARRSPGSALKPFTWLLALQSDANPADIIGDLPVEFVTQGGLYRPENYQGRPAGPVSLRTALACSLNLSAVRLLERYGGPSALIEALQLAGVSTLNRPADDYGLGLTIGGGEVTLLELSAAYATLARLGERCELRTLTGAATPGRVRLFDPDACWLLADILSDNDARAGTFGTTSPLRLAFPAAVKTGTSTGFRDNWAIGYTPRHTVGVWVGNFDGSPMQEVSGVSGAAPIFRDIMQLLADQHGTPWFAPREALVQLPVDPLTGLPVPDPWKHRRPQRHDWFVRERMPGPRDGANRYDPSGRVRLGPEYAAWLAGPGNWLTGDAVAVAEAHDSGPLQILAPLPGTRILLDSDLPQGGRVLTLRANRSARPIHWQSATLEILADGTSARLTPGRHEIRASDGTSSAVTWIEVRPR